MATYTPIGRIMLVKNEKEYVDLISQMVLKDESEIFKMFEEIDGAIVYGQGDYKSVYIPGKRKDRVLLVAHVDTVWNDSPRIKIGYENGLMFSKNRIRTCSELKMDEEGNVVGGGVPISAGMGFGADDRAGVAMLYLFKDSGHSLLLTSGEETGCLGSCYLASSTDKIKEINNNQFAIQFDRKGRDDLVFYEVSTDAFQKYCVKETGYKIREGSFTDICVLCEDICGVNLSIGYKNEHTHSEILNMRWWLNTLFIVQTWIGKKNLIKFSL